MAGFPTRRLAACALAAALACHGAPVFALGLVQAYESALQNDPDYRAAIHESEAGQQYKVLGRANLLPGISMSYAKSRNRADITAPNFLGQIGTTHTDYPSSSGTVSLRQPLFNLDGIARYQQGIAQSSQSEARFVARRQDLILRLVGAYADAKFAEDQLALALAQRDSYAEQKKLNARMFEKGEGTRTDVLETQAKFDLAEAQVLEARDSLIAARDALSAIVGVEVSRLDSLSDDFRVQPVQPASFDEWKTLALEHNAEIAVQRHAVEAAKQEINRSRAGHAPRVDLVASYNRSESETLSTRNQDATVRSIGVQLNIPFYAGGSVVAATSQAVAMHEKARADLDAKTTRVLVELRKQFGLVLSSAARIGAMENAVRSARELVQATRQSVKGGERINLDVLHARQQLYAAQRDLAQARYNYLTSYLKLRFAAGTLTAGDLHTVAGYFRSGPRDEAAPVAEAEAPQRMPAGLNSAAAGMNAKSSQSGQPAVAGRDAEREEVFNLVAAWARAWSAQDVDAYLAFYAEDFRPGDGRSHEAWARERRARIEGKGRIAVTAESPQVTVNGETATVRLRQVYRSDRLTDVARKVLYLARRDGKWKIMQESLR